MSLRKYWRNFAEQADEVWQQFLYALEVATAGSDDMPWLDTLNFFWDSLPDAEKLTTAERRRLAHSMKQMVREQVHKYYTHELAQKQAIHLRQCNREALAQQHLQQLAAERQRQMQELSETARQQSLVLPEQLQGEWLLPSIAEQAWQLLPEQQQQDGQLQCQSPHGWAQQQQQQQRAQEAVAGRVQVVNHGQGQQKYHMVRQLRRQSSTNSSSSSTRLLHTSSAGHVVTEIQVDHSGLAFGSRWANSIAGAELQQPLLTPQSPFAAEQQQQQELWDLEEQKRVVRYQPPSEVVISVELLDEQHKHQKQREQLLAGGTSSRSSSHNHVCVHDLEQPGDALLQPQSIAQHTQHTQQGGSRGGAVQLHQRHFASGGQQGLPHSGSQLLLERYLSGSSAGIVDEAAAAAAVAAASLAGCEALRLCSALPMNTVQGDCGIGGGLMHSVSEPPSEWSLAAASSTVDQHSCSSSAVEQTVGGLNGVCSSQQHDSEQGGGLADDGAMRKAAAAAGAAVGVDAARHLAV